MKLNDLILRIISINWSMTIRMNLKLLIQYAIKLPIICYGRFSIYNLSGKVQIKTLVIRTAMIQIGYYDVGILDKRISTTLNLWGTIIFNGKTSIARGSGISIGKNSNLCFGDNFTITGKSEIICTGNKDIIIGDNVMLSWDILIMNSDFHSIFDKKNNIKLNLPNDIHIGNNVWIGCRSTILKGSIIPNNSVIAASSLISGKLSVEGCVYNGMPIKIIKENIYWKP